MEYVVGFVAGAFVAFVLALFWGGRWESKAEKELADLRNAFSNHLFQLDKVLVSLESEAAEKARAAIARLREAFRL